MRTFELNLEDDLVTLLNQPNKPVSSTVRELVVLELYRQGIISSGKAAELLGFRRFDFVDYASHLGIPYFSLTEDDWETDRRQFSSL